MLCNGSLTQIILMSINSRNKMIKSWDLMLQNNRKKKMLKLQERVPFELERIMSFLKDSPNLVVISFEKFKIVIISNNYN